jgi:hypothetical protein
LVVTSIKTSSLYFPMIVIFYFCMGHFKVESPKSAVFDGTSS